MKVGKHNSGLPALILFVFGIIGLLVAAIQQMAYDNEFILHLYLEAAEVPGLQIITIVMFLIFGAIAAALFSK